MPTDPAADPRLVRLLDVAGSGPIGAAKPDPNPPVWWAPQPGPQALAAICPADEVFFGGTRGGGKSDCALGRQLRGAAKWGTAWNGLLVRRKYKDLKELRRRIDGLVAAGMPAERVGGEEQVNVLRFSNGAAITLVAIHRIQQADDYQGHQYTEITLDEAPTIPFIGQLIDRLKGCLRSPAGVPCSMFLTGNPGGAGAGQIRAMYVPFTDGGLLPVRERQVHRLKDGTTRVFIRSELADNPALVRNDPQYVKRLLSISDKQLRDAWLLGKWDAFPGQAFEFGPRHIIKPIWPIPQHAPLYMTFDWGYGAPFSIGWWWVDADGRLYRFAEWYGWDRESPANTGLRLTDQQIAEGILAREKRLGILGRPITRLSGPDCFSKKPDYRGGGQGPSTAEEFSQYSASPAVQRRYPGADLALFPGDPSRELKIRQFRQRLQVPDDPEELPMLVAYDTCKDFIRIIPSLCTDELTHEYLEPGQELHPFDEACHVCMARPMAMEIPEAAGLRQAQAPAGPDDLAQVANREHDAQLRVLAAAAMAGVEAGASDISEAIDMLTESGELGDAIAVLEEYDEDDISMLGRLGRLLG